MVSPHQASAKVLRICVVLRSMGEAGERLRTKEIPGQMLRQIPGQMLGPSDKFQGECNVA